MSDSATKIRRLAKVLERSKRRQDCMLVLGWNTVPRRVIEDELLRNEAGLDDDYITNLDAISRLRQVEELWGTLRGSNEHTRYVASIDDPIPYEALVDLIREGYFTTIVSSDITDRLERALSNATVLVDYYYVPELNPELKETLLSRPASRPRVIKLHGGVRHAFDFANSEVKAREQQIRELLEGQMHGMVVFVEYDRYRDSCPLPNHSQVYFASGQPLDRDTANLLAWMDDRQHILGPEGALPTFFEQLRDALVVQAREGRDAPRDERLQEMDSALPKPKAENDPSESEPSGTAERSPAARETATPYPEAPSAHPSPPRPAPPDQPVEILAPPALLDIQVAGPGQSVTFRLRSDRHNYQSKSAAQLNVDSHLLTKIANQLPESLNWRMLAQDQGKRFFKSLFEQNPDLLQTYGRARALADGDDRLQLCFSANREYLGYPFELLHDGEPLITRHPLFRTISGVMSRGPSLGTVIGEATNPKGSPIRILLAASNAFGDLDVDREIGELAEKIEMLMDARQIRHQIRVMPTSDATIDAFCKELKRGMHHIIHFAGHGVFDEEAPEKSFLWIMKKRRTKLRPQRLESRMIHNQLSAQRNKPALFFFNCCVAATTASRARLTRGEHLGIVDAVIRAGVSAVLGYRWKVSDTGASQFARTFYESLIESRCVIDACFSARRHLYSIRAEDNAWASPILVAQG